MVINKEYIEFYGSAVCNSEFLLAKANHVEGYIDVLCIYEETHRHEWKKEKLILYNICFGGYKIEEEPCDTEAWEDLVYKIRFYPTKNIIYL